MSKQRGNRPLSVEETAIDELNLDTLLSGDALFSEWNIEEYDELVDFPGDGANHSAGIPLTTTQQRLSASGRHDQVLSSLRTLNTGGADNIRLNRNTGAILGKKNTSSVALPQTLETQNEEKVSSVEQSSKATGKRKLQTIQSEYFISTVSGDPSSLFSTKDQRIVHIQSAQTTKDIARKTQARMALLAKESCGVVTSTKFHPYMALPDEVSMQKIGSYFPLLDLVSSTSVAQDSQSLPLERVAELMNKCTKATSEGNAETTAGLDVSTYDSSDFVLLQVFRKFLGIRCDVSTSANVSVKAGAYAPSNMKSIALAIKELQHVNRNQLALELEDAWRLVQRQRAFFKQNLNNLAHWCKTNFTQDMNASLFSVEKVYSSEKDEMSSLPSSAGAHAYATSIGTSLDSLFSFYSPPFTEHQNIYCHSDPSKLVFVNVKVKDTPRDTFPRLLAIMQPHEAEQWNQSKTKTRPSNRKRGLPKIQNELNGDIATKVRASKKSSTNRSNIKKSTIPKPMVPSNNLLAPSYDEVKPELQRESISTLLTKTASGMEVQFIESEKKRRLEIQQIEKKVLSTNVQSTKELWDVLQQQHYFGTVPVSKAKEELVIAWNPELPARETYWTDIPTPIVQSAIYGTNVDSESIAGTKPPSSSSLYHRLQSLLVEENSGGEGDEDNINESAIDESAGHALLVEKGAQSYDAVDVSGLTLDQRAFIHLRAANLIDRSLWGENPKVIHERMEDDKHVPSNGNLNHDHEDLDDTIRKTQMELTKQHRLNNETASCLLNGATVEFAKSASIQDQSVIIDNYNQLMKKEKEMKKVNSSKFAGDLPW